VGDTKQDAVAVLRIALTATAPDEAQPAPRISAEAIAEMRRAYAEMDADLNAGKSEYAKDYENPSALDLIEHMEQWAQQPAPRISADDNEPLCTCPDCRKPWPKTGIAAALSPPKPTPAAEPILARIHNLEDAITEAGIMLAGGDIPGAMKRLGQVMGPDVMRRQGI
jgi:hypothetical protein